MATSKGYPASTSLDRTKASHVTVEPIRDSQHGESTVSHATLRLVASDLSEATSDTFTITATAHSALAGDVILFQSGTFAGKEVKAVSVTANTITLAENMASAIGTGVAFDILRHKYPVVNAGGGVVNGGTSVVNTNYHSFATTNVTTAAWHQITASTSGVVNSFDMDSSANATLEIGIGGAGSEVRLVVMAPGSRIFPVRIAAGTRVAMRALGANATTGELSVNFYA